MSSALTHCNNCGVTYEPIPDAPCPNCGVAPIQVPPITEDLTPPPAAIPPPAAKTRSYDILIGILVWFGSVGLLFIVQIAGLLLYFGIKLALAGEKPSLVINTPVALVTLATTFVAHILTLGLCWVVVTKSGKRPFWESLGWRWHTQFKWVHAVALAIGMFGLGIVLEKVLPHGETEFEKMLRLSAVVRYAIAALAVFSAPLVEEIVYRGVLYGAFERLGKPGFGVAIVTLLFAVVHVPQYWGSPASITAILLISLVLTLLRASTRQLLPSVATHLVFNGVQALILIIRPPEAEKVDAGLAMLRQVLGLS
jgi:membrane protease YdiL (CAAX protease family)